MIYFGLSLFQKYVQEKVKMKWMYKRRNFASYRRGLSDYRNGKAGDN